MKVEGFVSGCHKYRLHIVLQTGQTFTCRVIALTQRELDYEAKVLIKARGYWEEVDRVYATRIDCITMPERVRRVA